MQNQCNKLNKTFARRIGKSLSDTNKDILANQLPSYLYSPEKLATSEYKKIFLEVGFGMGEHFFNQINLNPDSLYVGVEVYLNGVAKILKQLKNTGHSNFMIWPDDLDLILENLPKKSLDGIYVLFPDPWHKRKYLKKRLFNQNRLNSFKDKLKSGGFVSFASDIEDYFKSACTMFDKDSDFTTQKSTDYFSPHSGYIQTKYHDKAIKEGRHAQFITAVFRKLF